MDPVPNALSGPPPSGLRAAWANVRRRILGGLVLVLPILITFWVVHWIYTTLVTSLIGPLARVVVFKAEFGRADPELPCWFETYAAPALAIVLALLLLYGLGFLVNTRLRRAIDWALLRVPVVSVVYDGVSKVFKTLDNQAGQARPQRVVLIQFPHPGMKAPAFVTSVCTDKSTRQTLLCVYVPTTPVPTSGYFLIVPEEEVIELDWTAEQALQAIISGGLTAPPELSYFKSGPAES